MLYCESPSPLLHCITPLGDNIAGQGYWVSLNGPTTGLCSSWPANIRHSHNVVLMLGQYRRRWSNIKTTLGWRFLFAMLCRMWCFYYKFDELLEIKLTYREYFLGDMFPYKIKTYFKLSAIISLFFLNTLIQTRLTHFTFAFSYRPTLYRLLGLERVYLPLCEVADTLFHIQWDDIYTWDVNDIIMIIMTDIILRR